MSNFVIQIRKGVGELTEYWPPMESGGNSPTYGTALKLLATAEKLAKDFKSGRQTVEVDSTGYGKVFVRDVKKNGAKIIYSAHVLPEDRHPSSPLNHGGLLKGLIRQHNLLGIRIALNTEKLARIAERESGELRFLKNKCNDINNCLNQNGAGNIKDRHHRIPGNGFLQYAGFEIETLSAKIHTQMETREELRGLIIAAGGDV